MRQLFIFFNLLFCTLYVQAQEIQHKGLYTCTSTQIQLHLDLEDESLEVPGYEFFGPMGGYIDGKGVYGVWFLTSHKTEGRDIILRFSNDTGSDSQTIKLTANKDGSVHYATIGNNCIRKVEGRKLVKIEDEMDMQFVDQQNEADE